MAIGLKREGRRSYFIGAPYDQKDAWWLSKEAVAEELAARLNDEAEKKAKAKAAAVVGGAIFFTKIGEAWSVKSSQPIAVGKVTVSKADGSKTEAEVERSYSETVDGVTTHFGVLAPKKRKSTGSRPVSASRYRYPDRGNRAPGGRTCSYCGSNECSKAWNPRALCDED